MGGIEIHSLICYHVLTDGLSDKAPSYLIEKLNLLSEGLDAFGHLDYKNQKKAIDYCLRWGVDVPSIWLEANDAQLKAAKELGFEI